MIPSNEGLIKPFLAWLGSFQGLMTLDFIWLIAGVLGCIVLTVAKSMSLVKSAPPLTTQVDLMTGKKDHGIGRWFLFYASFTIAPPLLFGIVRTLIEAVNRLNAAVPYWWIIAGLVAVCIVCALVYRRFRIPHRKPAPVVEEPVPEPVVELWGLPEGMPQWDQR